MLLDCPAGVIPVRAFDHTDLELGKEMEGRVLGSWDQRNRQLWDEKITDRRVYLGTPLSIQVVAPRLHDFELCQIMNLMERALKTAQNESRLWVSAPA